MRTNMRKSGQSLVEFALILPMMLLLLSAFFDIGRALYIHSSLSTAVREGTRFAIVNEAALDAAYPQASTGDIVNKVLNYASGMDVSKVSVLVQVTRDTTKKSLPNTQVEITASYCFKAITPFVTQLLGNNCVSGAKGILIDVGSSMQVNPAGW